MKKFAIYISYSWGDEETPIVIERDYKEKAFEYMIDLAMKETKVAAMGYDGDYVTIKVMPHENKIILHYGYDNEECYYELLEELTEE